MRGSSRDDELKAVAPDETRILYLFEVKGNRTDEG